MPRAARGGGAHGGAWPRLYGRSLPRSSDAGLPRASVMAGESGSHSVVLPPSPPPASGSSAEEGAAAGPAREGYDPKCVFCRIALREEPGTQLLPCEPEDLVCFQDIRPGAPHHYLVVPKKHIGNCKTLKKEDTPLVEKMITVGKTVLQQKNVTDLSDVRMGFHWPPFCSVAHLHLHVLAPASQLGFLSRLVYRLNSYWFITADQLIERLQAGSATS
ncbi:histidine triad nucleotide-binding protein 3 [Trichosurus vulpecula]|uniref:histidine triad nucleotide-binding protein 3 n=1 Tax=Trichosurus vulpecula TaxID=9337 RepID=UPI00186AFC6B|nr:histidine triad nucleotide-binding protein 3 [Trichosurus vulpecula]